MIKINIFTFCVEDIHICSQKIKLLITQSKIPVYARKTVKQRNLNELCCYFNLQYKKLNWILFTCVNLLFCLWYIMFQIKHSFLVLTTDRAV